MFLSLLHAEHELPAILQRLQSPHAAEEVFIDGRRLRGGPARGLRVGDPVEVFEVQPEHRGDRPRGLGKKDDAIEWDRRKELPSEFLIVDRGETEGGAISSRHTELGEDSRIALGHFRSRGHEEGRQAKALGHLELGGDVRHREAARGVRVAEAHDVEKELLLGGRLHHLVVLEPALQES